MEVAVDAMVVGVEVLDVKDLAHVTMVNVTCARCVASRATPSFVATSISMPRSQACQGKKT